MPHKAFANLSNKRIRHILFSPASHLNTVLVSLCYFAWNPHHETSIAVECMPYYRCNM